MSDGSFWSRRGAVDAAGAAALVAITAAAGYLGVLPHLEAARADEAARQAQTEGEAQADQARRELRGLRARLDTVRSQADPDSPPLQRPAAINRRVAGLARLAERHGLVVEGIEPGRAQSLGVVTTSPLIVTGLGGYPNLAAFLTALRADPGDTAAVSVRLERVAPDDDEPAIARFRVELAWYALPEDASQPEVQP
ncbi:MAG: hypothetical protein AAGA57_09085 [Planctomycetota bacterium]